MAASDFNIIQGKTFERVLRWEAPPVNYAAITGIARAAPVIITALAHGIPDGWRVAVASVKGMKELNALNDPPENDDYHKARVLDTDTVELNEVNAFGFSPYDPTTASGVLRYNTPVDLTDFTARMHIRKTASKTSPILYELSSATGEIVIDNLAKTITLNISAADSDLFTWKTGVYSVEMKSPSGQTTRLLGGEVNYILDPTR